MSLLSNALFRCLSTCVFPLFVLVLFSSPVSADLLVANTGEQLETKGQILRFNENTGELLGYFDDEELNYPVGLVLDGNGNLLVTNRDDGRILKYNVNTGDYLGDFYNGGQLFGPTAAQFGPDGSLYVANFFGTSISRLDANGNFLGDFTPLVNGPTMPSSFAFNAVGDLFVGSFGTSEVLRYNSSGQYLGAFASGIAGASGLIFDDEGDLWVAGLMEHKIYEFKPDGSSTSFTTNFEPLTETYPGYIMFAPGNQTELWVSLTGGGGVYRYLTDGTFLGPVAVSGGFVPGQAILISAVPEPGSGLLLAGTAVILCGLRRRRAG